MEFGKASVVIDTIFVIVVLIPLLRYNTDYV